MQGFEEFTGFCFGEECVLCFDHYGELVIRQVAELVIVHDRVIMHRQTVGNEHASECSECSQQNGEFIGYRKRENSMKNAMIQSQKVLDQMKENAKKSSQLIIANAEVEAEKILNRAHKRLSQLHSDIIELKRQRIQLEMQISGVLESHSKLLEMTKEENKAADETDSTLKFIKQA